MSCYLCTHSIYTWHKCVIPLEHGSFLTQMNWRNTTTNNVLVFESVTSQLRVSYESVTSQLRVSYESVTSLTNLFSCLKAVRIYGASVCIRSLFMKAVYTMVCVMSVSNGYWLGNHTHIGMNI